MSVRSTHRSIGVRGGLAIITLSCAISSHVADGQWVRREFSELHMGMPVRIVVHAQYDSAARAGARAAFATIASLEDVMSDYRAASEVRRLSAAPSGMPVVASADLCIVLDAALTVARLSDGAFDPTIAPLVELWRDTRRTGALPSPSAVAAARSAVGWSRVRLDATGVDRPGAAARPLRAAREGCTVTLDHGVRLDVGGIAKGYILDRALAALTAHGITRALIEAGGDIVVGDPPPGTRGWRIGVPHDDTTLVARAASLANAAISTSGGTEQFVEIDGRRYSHIVDPRTGLGSTTGALVTVVAPTAMTADALATALAMLEQERAAALLAHYPGVVAARRFVLAETKAPTAPK